ncbi:MAG TPA: alcohol dehydrogenase catalytic domain-containing protein [Candidatus Sulfotelmatobacter sp.]|nr:alcohol dehydrogenase catalytic domain-containing protein [Candidatus Sulfotelmatobacter sp.]
MKAMLLHELGGRLTLADVPRPKPGPNEAVVRVRAAGVGLTLAIMRSNPGIVTHYPRIIGHEVAGDVAEVGSEVEALRPGDRVTCHFYLTCKRCRYCRSGRETLCESFKGYVGMACDGGFAEYVALPALNLCRLPPGLPYLDAAIAADAICTPLHVCRGEARIGPGDDVLIVGAGGGVGVHMVQMARACGGRVLAVDLGPEKLAMARELGAEVAIDAAGVPNWAAEVMARTDGRGVDAAIDIVATAASLPMALSSLARGGRLVIVGHRPKAVFKADPTFPVDPSLVLYKALEIHGSRYVSMAELAQTLEVVRRGTVRPIVTRTFPLEGAEEALRLVQEGQVVGRAALLLD